MQRIHDSAGGAVEEPPAPARHRVRKFRRLRGAAGSIRLPHLRQVDLPRPAPACQSPRPPANRPKIFRPAASSRVAQTRTLASQRRDRSPGPSRRDLSASPAAVTTWIVWMLRCSTHNCNEISIVLIARLVSDGRYRVVMGSAHLN
jgi:hypothetical protein